MRLARRLTGGLLVAALSTAIGLPAAGQAQDNRFSDASLAEVTASPDKFDGLLVRVGGVLSVEFEGTVLAVDAVALRTSASEKLVWIEVGWPVSDALKAMHGEQVIVEARVDGHRGGHMGCCPASLRDIRSIWRPGREESAVSLNHQTRDDALEQLEFRTGWIWLGALVDDMGWITEPEFLTASSVGPFFPIRFPRQGEFIQLARRSRIHILDYRVSGEARRLESPMLRGTRQQSSETDLWLPEGSFVQVGDVLTHVAGEIRNGWARVIPIPEP